METANSYAYQRDYQRRYDFDVQKRISRQERRKAEVSARDRGRIFLLLIAAGFLALGVIVAAAYGAAINYSNNQLKNSNAALRSEVDTLEVQLQSATNIAEIQEKAMRDLGMVYAKGEEYVDLSKTAEPENLAVVLKDNAYE